MLLVASRLCPSAFSNYAVVKCFDYGFMVYSKVDLKPFAVFIDTRSGKEEVNDDTSNNYTVTSIRTNDNDKINFQY
jgi:hypothetical protein